MTDLREVPMPDLEGMKDNAMIVRCDRGNGFKVNALCLSDRPFGTETHFMSRTIPCTGKENGCQGCAIGRRTAWVGYFAATNHDRTRRFLIEVTPNCMIVVKRWLDLHGSMRGAWCTLERRSKRDTGRVSMSIAPNGLGLAPADIPEAFDVQAALRKIWGLPDRPPVLSELLVGDAAKQRHAPLPLEASPDRISGNGQHAASGVQT